MARSSLHRDKRQFCSFNREGSNFRVISAGAGSERALLSRARVSGRKDSLEQTSPCLAIRSPHMQTTKGEPISSKLVDEHITIHYVFYFVLNKFLLKPKASERRHLISMCSIQNQAEGGASTSSLVTPLPTFSTNRDVTNSASAAAVVGGVRYPRLRV